jgi:hypothetical protein
MKDVEIVYWGKTPLTNIDVYMLNIINEDGTKTPVYSNDRVFEDVRLMCDYETATAKKVELLNVL